jgi:hypothetical protein
VGAGAGAAAAAPVLFLRAGERTDELRVQIEYLLTQTREALNRLVRPDGDEPATEAATEEPWPQESWAGRLAASFDDDDVRRRVVDEHRRASQRWKALLAELAALGRYKQRLATHHLLARLIDFVPRARDRAARAREATARANARLAEIIARSVHDAETDSPIVPPQFAAEYSGLLADRDRAQHDVARTAKSLQSAAEHVRARLSKTKLVGSADLPALRVLGPLPPRLVEMQPSLGDAALAGQVSRLEQALGTSLRGAPPAGAE